MAEDTMAVLRRRKQKRYGQSGAVTLRRVVSEPSLSGSLFDLSTGGCLIWMDFECCLADGDIVEVRLNCDPLSFRVLGSVRHLSEANRVLGIEFHRLGAKDLSELTGFIARLEATAERETALAIA